MPACYTNRYIKKKILIFLAALLFAFTTQDQNVHAQDITPPNTTYTMTPSSPDGNNDWYISVVQFDLEATDLESGIKEINYRIDGSAWQKASFTNTLNLAPNPSFEIPSAITSSGVDGWEATSVGATYSQDTLTAKPSYEVSSAKIESSSTGWHGINNKDNYVVTTPYDHMTASVWVKSPSTTGQAKFFIYAIGSDGSVEQIAVSHEVTGKSEWTLLSIDFVVNKTNAIGVYMDAGLNDTGTIWLDAVSITSSSKQTGTTFTVATDSENHTVEFYSVDNAGNIETYDCAIPVNCVTFKQDMSPPANWHNAGAIRGLFGSSHEVYVYTEVDDPISGLSTFTDKYMYKTDFSPDFGRYSNLLSCSSTWQSGVWTVLISPPFLPGAKTAYLITPKTDFCNNDWKTCKTVRFYAEDLAGNSTTKDYCINGPWIRFQGGGDVRSNNSIDMVAEAAEGSNTDGLVEVSTANIGFFTSSKSWYKRGSQIQSYKNYDELWNSVSGTKTEFTGDLPTSSGVFYYNGNYTADNSSIPNSYNSTTFTQVIFINGDLTISRALEVSSTSAALFVVKGNVNIEKSVGSVKVAIFADGTVDTASDIAEGDATDTLILNGVYSANKFRFLRTLQGTNNQKSPSEDFLFEPKYLLKLKDYFGNRTVRWKSVE